nr:NADH dehydrogenase subunit 6 [Loricera pilicornis]
MLCIYYILMIINTLMTLIFLFLKHPLSMGLIILIQTISISLMSGMYCYSYWFSYILFIVMLGGMLILFIYMTSIASNEMFNFSMKMTLLIILLTILLMMIYMIIDYMNLTNFFTNINMMKMLDKFNFMKIENMTLKMIYNKPNNLITLMLINYLFLTLIAVVKITDLNYGPLRQKF